VGTVVKQKDRMVDLANTSSEKLRNGVFVPSMDSRNDMNVVLYFRRVPTTPSIGADTGSRTATTEGNGLNPRV